MTMIRISGRRIGEREPCFIIAEAGSNHNASLPQAKRLIDVAAEAGADSVKFQVFRAEHLYPRNAGRTDYLDDPTPIYDIIAAMELPYEWIPELAAHCADKGVVFLASVFDEESADRLDPYVAAHKIASYEMTHLPLLRHVARKGKPVILSTGTATLDEVAASVRAFREAGGRELALMQCTASYPAPPESLNLRAIVTLRSAFGAPAGLSDHSRDPLVGPLGAVALGANLLEKHYTLDNSLPGPDHRYAVEPDELRRMIQAVRDLERALGSGEKVLHPVERELHAFARRYVFAIRAIRRGEALTTENVRILRKGKQPAGLPPSAWEQILGRSAARDLRAEEPVQAEDIA